ncbi:MAG: DedA family protein [Anaerolineae bacterium]|nr:DedA family protein [Anaerolineae bacterium]
MFIENIFPPIPSEIILPLAGNLSLSGHFTLLGITLAGMSSSVLGAWVFYGIGYWMDENRIRLLISRFGKWLFISESDFNRAIYWFSRHGDWVIFFLRFTLFTALGTACWSFCLAFAGKMLGENWIMVEGFISRYEKGVLIMAIIAVGIFLFFKIKKSAAQTKVSDF